MADGKWKVEIDLDSSGWFVAYYLETAETKEEIWLKRRWSQKRYAVNAMRRYARLRNIEVDWDCNGNCPAPENVDSSS